MICTAAVSMVTVVVETSVTVRESMCDGLRQLFTFTVEGLLNTGDSGRRCENSRSCDRSLASHAIAISRRPNPANDHNNDNRYDNRSGDTDNDVKEVVVTC